MEYIIKLSPDDVRQLRNDLIVLEADNKTRGHWLEVTTEQILTALRNIDTDEDSVVIYE